MPSWAESCFDELTGRVETLPDRLPIESLCHRDVRDDNLLVRADGSVVIFDWGMSRLGPAWADLFLLNVSWAEHPGVAHIGADAMTVTDLLLGLGGWLALRSTQPAPPGIPTMPGFRARESRRMLAAAHRRLNEEKP
jgi:serine/threonine protein kinase